MAGIGKENREILMKIESEFKANNGGSTTKSYTKKEFYDFLQKKENIDRLEDA